MEMQGNTTEIDERNLLQLDALLSHGYGLSPQLVMRSKGLSIEAKALYGYLSSFAGAGDTAFPSTSRILEELDISKNRFYKIRKELVSWGFISIETTATSAGLRTVYTLPQNPIAIKTEIDEIANRRNEIKSSLVANLHNEDMVSHKRDSESECGYLFRDNGYRIKVFNTIEFNKSMHYNPLKYVKTDADILSFVNCLISNTNGDKQSGGDPFWENSERLLYTALIALLRDWFPPEDYSLDGLLTLLSMAEAKENDENFKSPLDMIFDEIETGKVYERNPFYQGPSTSSSYADAESDRMAISENTTDEFTWQSSLMERNNDGLSPAREGGLTSDQDFALANYKMFKVAAGDICSK